MRGLYGRDMADKTKTICHLFQRSTADVICLLDTHLGDESESKLQKLWKGDIFLSCNQFSHQTAGIAILTKNFDTSKSTIIRDPNGRFCVFKFSRQNTCYCVVAVYAPSDSSTSRVSFFESLHKTILEHYSDGETLILLGDFNCVDNPLLDKVSKSTKDTSFNTLSQITSQLQLEDGWRRRNPESREFTFFSNVGFHSRLDRAYTSISARSNISMVFHQPFAHSDHSSVHVAFSEDNVPFGPCTWVLNQNLLSDPEYVTKVQSFWTKWQERKSLFPNLLKWWDSGKAAIKKLSIAFSKRKSKIKNKITKSLYKRLRNAQNQNKPLLISQLKSEISALETKAAKEHFLLLKIKWMDEGEDCTKYFLNLKSKPNEYSKVTTIRDESGNTFTDNKGIIKNFTDFYKDLFTQVPVCSETQEELITKIKHTLSDDQKSESDRAFTKNDFKHALSKLPNGKSPGKDGLPSEFYKTFWNLLGDDFFQVMNFAFSKGMLPNSLREAIIKCLPKKGDISLVKNWRPISLLNADYKILAKALSIRVFQLLPHVISEEQTCSVKGRKITHNLLILRDFVKYADENQLEACLISLDQMKAFDRVNWDFLFKVLHKMNFGNELIKWIQLLYNRIYAHIKVNGFLSAKFILEQGVRQGCPLSPMLYVIIAEVLNQCIDSNPSIKGVEVNGFEIKLSQYADDTSCLLTGDDSIHALFETLQIYERATGAKINLSKTQALWLGSNVGRSDAPLGLEWSNDCITVLGLPFGNMRVNLSLWQSKQSSIRKSLIPWKLCNLSLKGKVIVIKQIMLPKITYAANIYPPCNNVLMELKKILEDFLWSGKRPKVPTQILYRPICFGGLSLTNLVLYTKSLRLCWVKEIFVSKSYHWKLFAFYFMNKYRNLFLFYNIFKITLSARCIKQANLPQFYADLLNDWRSFTKNERPQVEDPSLLREEPLFLNPLTKSVNPQKWFTDSEDKHISTIGELFIDCSENIMSLDQINQYHDIQISKPNFNILLKSIPETWKLILSHQSSDACPNFKLKVWTKDKNQSKSAVPVSTLSCKAFYDQLADYSFEKVSQERLKFKTPSYFEWQSKTGHCEWPKIFKFLYRNHLDKTIVDLQFRVLHSSVWTRERLFQAKVSPSPICLRCLQESETLEHLFVSCSETKTIWETAVKYMRAACPRLIFPNTFKAIIVGFSDIPELKHALYALEDIRLAFFKAVWFQRNRLLTDFAEINGPNIFCKFLQNFVIKRFKSNPSDPLPPLRNVYSLEKGLPKLVIL